MALSEDLLYLPLVLLVGKLRPNLMPTVRCMAGESFKLLGQTELGLNHTSATLGAEYVSESWFLDQ